MIETRDLPAVNATLNGTAAVLLVAGWVAIKRRMVDLHRRLMIAAVATSAVFLCSYLTYHALHGSRKFPGTGPVRIAYLTILLSHTVLAAAVVPLVLVTLYRAWRGQDERHRAIARWTLPIWLYVSVTGVTVYWLLYRVYGPA
jgi:putative membrane protein